MPLEEFTDQLQVVKEHNKTLSDEIKYPNYKNKQNFFA